jgi:hypothetical protein
MMTNVFFYAGAVVVALGLCLPRFDNARAASWIPAIR